MTYKVYIPILFIFTVIFSCKKGEDIPDPIPSKELEMTVSPYFGAEKLYLDSIYSDDQNNLIQFQEVRFYLTDIKNGSNLLTDVALFNYRETQNALFKVNGEFANFANLTCVLGVDSSRNHADPSAFSSSNPLNIMNAGNMHWGWNPGYTFVYIDAKMDTIPDGTTNLDHFISFHIGRDDLKQNLSFSTIPWVATNANLSTANLILDLKKFIYEPNILDLKNENVSHTSIGQDVLSEKVIVNFANSLRF